VSEAEKKKERKRFREKTGLVKKLRHTDGQTPRESGNAKQDLERSRTFALSSQIVQGKKKTRKEKGGGKESSIEGNRTIKKRRTHSAVGVNIAHNSKAKKRERRTKKKIGGKNASRNKTAGATAVDERKRTKNSPSLGTESGGKVLGEK